MTSPHARKRTEKLRAHAAGRRRKPLGLDAIVDVALRVVDREGVDAVSMRRVAAEFDTGPASLYAYIANKDELLRHVLDRVLDEIDVPETDDWQHMVRGYAHSVRAVYQRHNDLAKLNFAHVPTGEKLADGAERLLAGMISGGVPPQVAAWAMDVTSLYVTADVYEGWLYAQRFSDGSGRDPEEIGAEYFEAVGESFEQLSADRYPYLVKYSRELMTGSGDDRFAFGLDMIIAGMAAQIPGT